MQLAESRCEPDDAKSGLARVYARHNHSMNYCCIVVNIIRPSLQNNHSTGQEAHKYFAVALLLSTIPSFTEHLPSSGLPPSHCATPVHHQTHDASKFLKPRP